jgi:hypothetical protein
MGAVELETAIRNASGAGVHEWMVEVDRLRRLLIDIVDICNTDPVTWRQSSIEDYDKVLAKIDDVAHGYFTGGDK